MSQLTTDFNLNSYPVEQSLRDDAPKLDPPHHADLVVWLNEEERQKDQRESYLKESSVQRITQAANGDFRQRRLIIGPEERRDRITEEQVEAHIARYPELDGELAAKDRDDPTSTKIWEARFSTDRWEREQAQEYHDKFVADAREKMDELLHDQSRDKTAEAFRDNFNEVAGRRR